MQHIQRLIGSLGPLANPLTTEFLQPSNVQGFTPQEILNFLRGMHLIRSIESQIGSWAATGTARCPCHLGIGQEAIASGIAHALRSSDRLFGNHRSHAHYLAVGGDPGSLLAEVLGRVDGCASGLGGSMHLISTAHGFMGSVPIVGATIPIAVGAALALKMDGGQSIAVAYFGDGATEEGVLHESLNLAAIYGLPVLFVCENNLYSSHLDVMLRQPDDRMSRFSEAHKVRSLTIDGNDVIAVAKAARHLIDQMRVARTPAFLEAITYRWRGHVGPDENIDVGVRRRKEDVDAWKARDPISRLAAGALASGIVTQRDIDAVTAEVNQSVAAAAAEALESDYPTPATLLSNVYAEQ